MGGTWRDSRRRGIPLVGAVLAIGRRDERLARVRRRDDALEHEERAVLWAVFGNAEGRTLADASGRLAAARPRPRASARPRWSTLAGIGSLPAPAV